jgi:hypothetical protein
VTTSDHLLIEMPNRIEGWLAPESVEERQAIECILAHRQCFGSVFRFFIKVDLLELSN